MRSRTIMFCFVFLIIAIGCEPITEDETRSIPSPSSTLIEQSAGFTAPHISPTDQAQIPTNTFIQSTPRHPGEYQTITPKDKVQMPVFLEVTQTTMMGNNSEQSPTFGVGPTLYFYKPEIEVLLLSPTITLEPETEVLVGLASILQTPGQAFEKSEIIQYPSAQPFLIQVAAFDMATDTLAIIFADEKFDLSPGEKRTFKQFGGDSNTSTVITIISNHGRLTEIQQLSSDGSLR